MGHNYVKLNYTKSQIEKAGYIYISSGSSKLEKKEALKKINNWRAVHSYPLQRMYVNVKRLAPENAMVVQRLKRLYSITQKLNRFHSMRLTAMQDIGGCRVIVNSMKEVYDTINKIKRSRMKYDLKLEHNYIEKPKSDGYRSYHIVLSYNNEKKPEYKGLCVEIQLRTRIQHLWATAVETMDTFTGNPIKNGKGDSCHKDFFILVSKLFKIYEENDNNIESVKKSTALEDLISFEEQYGILNKLGSIKKAVACVEKTEFQEQGYFILNFNKKSNNLNVKHYNKMECNLATENYDLAEEISGLNEDVVLVSTSSYNTLRKAYPNYFSDISEFISLIESFKA